MRTINALYVIILILISIPAAAQNEAVAKSKKEKVFRFHSGLEPAAVDPAALVDAAGGFIFFNLYRGLYRLDKNNNPQPELAQKCTWQDGLKLRLNCTLRENLKFSNGENLKASHFVDSWRRLVDPATASRHSEMLMSIRNARKIINGELAPQELGVIATDDRHLQIYLESRDSEFLYRLSTAVLTPILRTPPTNPEEFASMVGTGPYRLSEWQRKTRVRLEPNPYYFVKNKRPPVEVLMIEEDSTAIQLYDLGKLDFLRRISVKEIEKRRASKEFHFIPTYRFDYIGFGPELKDYPEVRKALALSLNYPELTKAYLTPGKIGCPSLPARMAAPWPCLELNLTAANAAFDKAKPNFKVPMILTYSKAGGEDVGRGMEWMQSQWKKHLELQVSLRPMESGVFYQDLKTHPPVLFRKGTNLDRPTCLSALENFESSSPNNNIGLKNEKFDKIVAELRESDKRSKNLCGDGLKILINEYHLIPLGELYFPMLAKLDFRGWRVTPLNQLDLTELESTRP